MLFEVEALDRIKTIIVFTSGDNSHVELNSIEDFVHDQTGRYIAAGKCKGSFTINNNGVITNMVNCDNQTNISSTYTYK